ncbi:MAG: hypothetical protein RL033_4625, partial [Pseudomonadota bacterium]
SWLFMNTLSSSSPENSKRSPQPYSYS